MVYPPKQSCPMTDSDPPTPFQETAASLARSREQLKQICVTLQAMLGHDRRAQGHSVRGEPTEPPPDRQEPR